MQGNDGKFKPERDDNRVMPSWRAKRRNPYPSFRDAPKAQTRNLEIPGSMLRIAPE